jgi:SAM-dependent methyltransferase
VVPLFDHDPELVRYHQRLWPVLDVRPGDRVLDIGCGTGRTTRDAARAADRGSALGIDVSGPMLALARERAAAAGLGNIGFVQGDAQTHAFPPERFDLGVSRFGTMFFADPVAAFANIGRALRPGARLVQLVWQAGRHQEWDAAIRAALGGGPPAAAGPPPPDPAGDPFSLGDPEVVAGVLTAAGFTAVDVLDVREPICLGPDADRARDGVLQLRMAAELLAGQDSAPALDRLRATLDAHDTGDGVWFDSRAWLVTARRL